MGSLDPMRAMANSGERAELRAAGLLQPLRSARSCLPLCPFDGYVQGSFSWRVPASLRRPVRRAGGGRYPCLPR